MLRTMSFQPDWVSSPSDTLTSVIKERGYTLIELSEQLGRSLDEVNSVLLGKLKMDADFATDLERVFNVSKDFWLSRQSKYFSTIDYESRVRNFTEQNLVDGLPLASLKRLGWINCGRDAASKLAAALQLFAVNSIDEYKERYLVQYSAIAFRESVTYSSNPLSVMAWLRKAEMEAEKINCASWDKAKLGKCVADAKKLIRIKNPSEFLPKLKMLCASCGVALVIVAAPEGCRASGATKFLSDSKAIIALSLRYKSDDQFWFTFFHEVAHLQLHSEQALFLEDESDVTANEEHEANDFARNVLLPTTQFEKIASKRLGYKNIIRFAFEFGISPGILVGQLQHSGLIPFDKLNSLKRRYSWSNDGSPMLTP
jgi:HTH-type transcriptional regulator / antitoxin HigA